MKIFVIISVILLMTSCKSPEGSTEYVYKDVLTPISNVPMPPDTNCPEDAVEVLDSEKAKVDGEVAKAYRIAILQLRDCNKLREQVIDKYRDISKEDQQRIVDFKEENDVGPLGAPRPPNSETPAELLEEPTPSVVVSEMTYEEKIREVEIKRTFTVIEGDFENLKNRVYDIDDGS